MTPTTIGSLLLGRGSGSATRGKKSRAKPMLLSEPLSLHTSRQFLVATEERPGLGLGLGPGLAQGHGLTSQRAREIRRRARTRCQTVWSDAVAAAKAGGAGATDSVTTPSTAIEASGLFVTDIFFKRERSRDGDRDRDEPATTATAGSGTSAGGRDGNKDEGLIIIDVSEEGDTWTRPLLDVCEVDVAKAIEQRLVNRRKTPGAAQGSKQNTHPINIP